MKNNHFSVSDLRKRRRILALWLAALVFLTCSLAVYHLWEPVTVSFLDVGQGDACLIRAGKDGCVLVDGGDQGKGETLLRYFKLENITHLDAVFLSHLHSDHASGVLELLENKFPVEKIYMPDVESGSGLEEEILSVSKKQGIPVQRLARSDELTLGKMKYSVLWPGEDRKNLDLNNASLVLRLEWRENTLLLTGDLEKTAERKLCVLEGKGLEADVLKVPHHGGSSSAHKDFLAVCNPEQSVISVGNDNAYRDPSDTMLKELLEFGGIWRTDRDGTVTVTLGRNGIKRIDSSDKWR